MALFTMIFLWQDSSHFCAREKIRIQVSYKNSTPHVFH